MAVEDDLRKRLNTVTDLALKLKKRSRNYGFTIFGLIACGIVYSYFRLKSGYVRKAEKLL